MRTRTKKFLDTLLELAKGMQAEKTGEKTMKDGPDKVDHVKLLLRGSLPKIPKAETELNVREGLINGFVDKMVELQASMGLNFIEWVSGIKAVYDSETARANSEGFYFDVSAHANFSTPTDKVN